MAAQNLEVRRNERYQVLGPLGQGVYGQVFRGTRVADGRPCALKLFLVQQGEEGMPVSAMRELGLLKDLQRRGGNPNIIRLHEVWTRNVDGRMVYGVFELMMKDLKAYLRDIEEVRADVVQNVTRDVVSGVGYLHARGVMHRDLKPQNVLVNLEESGIVAKIGDFGMARPLANDAGLYTRNVVTLWYRAPELFLGANLYGREVDCWSVGCVIAEMAFRTPIFEGCSSEIGTLLKIFQMFGTPGEDLYGDVETEAPFLSRALPRWPADNLWSERVTRIDPDLVDRGFAEFARSLFALKPSDRMTMAEAGEHTFLQRDHAPLQGA